MDDKVFYAVVGFVILVAVSIFIYFRDKQTAKTQAERDQAFLAMFERLFTNSVTKDVADRLAAAPTPEQVNANIALVERFLDFIQMFVPAESVIGRVLEQGDQFLDKVDGDPTNNKDVDPAIIAALQEKAKSLRS